MPVETCVAIFLPTLCYMFVLCEGKSEWYDSGHNVPMQQGYKLML